MIADSLNAIKRDLPENVTLVAVSKTKPTSLILEAYNAGQRIFGENKVQELVSKFEEMPKDIEWHMIGHLQSNKVKYIASFVQLIHGVDSLKLLKEINKQAAKHDRVQDCLLQFHIAEEETKFGFDEDEVRQMISNSEFKALDNIRIVGVMGMATFTDNESQIRKEFRHLKAIFDHLKTNYFQSESFRTISMGMSGDYNLAIVEGSTMVRVGSSIFGTR